MIRFTTKALATGLLLAASTVGLADPDNLLYADGVSNDLVLDLAGAPPGGGYSLLQDQSDTGTTLRRPIVTGSAIPYDREWNELTDAQKQSLREHYQDLPAGDEPPYPVGGLYGIYKTISVDINHISPRYNALTLGPVMLGVVVAPDGHVTHVNVYAGRQNGFIWTIVHGWPRQHLSGLMDLRFKPGLCQERPCEMEFPVEFTIAQRP